MSYDIVIEIFLLFLFFTIVDKTTEPNFELLLLWFLKFITITIISKI